MNSNKIYYIDNIIKARRYLLASIILAAAGAVYELFSHGVYSYYMIYAFMIPLALGSLPHLADSRGIFEAAGTLSEMLLASSIATLSAGSLIKGVIDIYGTSNTLTTVYPILGFGLLIAAVCVIFAKNKSKKVSDI